MNARKPPSDTGRTRRVFVAVVIATAAAAVTASVALNGRRSQTPLAAGTDAGAVPTVTVPPSDPSLPAASEILKGVPAETGEPAPTF